MKRVPEPDLMNDAEQALAYAQADFEQPHKYFMELFQQQFPQLQVAGLVLDLGCGPGDISWRFARAYSQCHVDAVDGAAAMLKHGQELMAQQGMQSRVSLHHCYLPDDALPSDDYSVIISNSLLHHLKDAQILWQLIARYAASGAAIFIMDLLRPESCERAQALVAEYAADEPDILRQDFYHSLLAAYTVEEIKEQLLLSGLSGLTLKVVSDRHFIVSGYRAA